MRHAVQRFEHESRVLTAAIGGRPRRETRRGASSSGGGGHTSLELAATFGRANSSSSDAFFQM